MNLELRDKVAIVTGAAGGLGRSISEALAGEGARVIMADLDFNGAKILAKALLERGRDVLPFKTDVSLSKDLVRLVKETISRFGRVDILVNNAGICPRTSFERISEKEWDQVLAVNLKSAFFLSQQVFPWMKNRKFGRIINIASAAGKVGGVQVGAHYAASKAALICLTKTMALCGAKYGITANAVCPGVIGTDMTLKISRNKIDRYKEKIPLGRIGAAEDVAAAVLFLASERAGYITGETTDVNGGLVMD